jgi:neutral ceramidase
VCPLFGAEETICLARAAGSGDLHEVASSCMPAEIQIFTVGHVKWVGWPGEVFAEFALELYRTHPECAVITLANGDLQGYLVTQQAVADRVYEASNALFASPQSGEILVKETRSLLAKHGHILTVSPSGVTRR